MSTDEPITEAPPRREVLTVAQIAERWGCDPKGIRKLITDGKLVGFRIGARKFRVTLDELLRYEREGKAA